MEHIEKLTAVGQRPEKQRRPIIQVTLAERQAFSPAEFAALFGRGQTWGYRQLYSGRIKAIRNLGRVMVPRCEVERLSQELTVHNGKAK